MFKLSEIDKLQIWEVITVRHFTWNTNVNINQCYLYHEFRKSGTLETYHKWSFMMLLPGCHRLNPPPHFKILSCYPLAFNSHSRFISTQKSNSFVPHFGKFLPVNNILQFYLDKKPFVKNQNWNSIVKALLHYTTFSATCLAVAENLTLQVAEVWCWGSVTLCNFLSSLSCNAPQNNKQEVCTCALVKTAVKLQDKLLEGWYTVQ